MQSRNYYIYLATNKVNTVIYTGVTNDLIRRMWEHKQKFVPSFASRYNVTKLVYFEIFEDIQLALNREKQIKAGSRKKKIELIKSKNPDFRDLYESLI